MTARGVLPIVYPVNCMCCPGPGWGRGGGTAVLVLARGYPVLVLGGRTTVLVPDWGTPRKDPGPEA